MMLTLADDSGLEVDALDGAPGVRSARFAHERATDAENNAALLAALDALPDAVGTRPLTARFRCVLALVDPYASDGEPIVVEGRCEGTITRTPRGSGGFGYDPLFVVDGTDKTMAELTEAEKNRSATAPARSPRSARCSSGSSRSANEAIARVERADRFRPLRSRAGRSGRRT